MKLWVSAFALLLLAAPLLPGKDSLEMLEAFWNYDSRKTENDGKGQASTRLDALLADDKHGLVEALQTLAAVRRQRGVSAIAGLEKLRAVHQARTFKALYPDEREELKAADFEQRFCDRIDVLLAELRAEAAKPGEVPKPVVPVAPADLVRMAAELEAAVKQADFSPSPTLHARTEVIRNAALALIMGLGNGNVAVDSGEAKAVAAAIRAALAKLDAAVVENFRWHKVVANVRTPEGAPNAAAGMDPRGIADPELRRQYLEAIAENQVKNEENAQQSCLVQARSQLVHHVLWLEQWASAAGISKEELATRFTAEGPSRGLLREKLGLEKTPAKKPAKK